MRRRYSVIYVNENNEMLSFETLASNWQELKDNIDKELPKNTKYLSHISILWD